jgi:hypothetical protein
MLYIRVAPFIIKVFAEKFNVPYIVDSGFIVGREWDRLKLKILGQVQSTLHLATLHVFGLFLFNTQRSRNFNSGNIQHKNTD